MCRRTSSLKSSRTFKSLKPTNKAPELSSGIPILNLVNISTPSKTTVPFFLILDSNFIESLVALVLAASVKILSDSTIHSSMILPLFLMTAAFVLFSLLIFLMKYNTELIKIKNKGLERL